MIFGGYYRTFQIDLQNIMQAGDYCYTKVKLGFYLTDVDCRGKYVRI